MQLRLVTGIFNSAPSIWAAVMATIAICHAFRIKERGLKRKLKRLTVDERPGDRCRCLTVKLFRRWEKNHALYYHTELPGINYFYNRKPYPVYSRMEFQGSYTRFRLFCTENRPLLWVNAFFHQHPLSQYLLLIQLHYLFNSNPYLVSLLWC